MGLSLWAWWLIFASMSLYDYQLTAAGLQRVGDAVELNPIAATLFTMGDDAALVGKLAAIGITLVGIIMLGTTRWRSALQAVLIASAGILFAINCLSLLQLNAAGAA